MESVIMEMTMTVRGVDVPSCQRDLDTLQIEFSNMMAARGMEGYFKVQKEHVAAISPTISLVIGIKGAEGERQLVYVPTDREIETFTERFDAIESDR